MPGNLLTLETSPYLLQHAGNPVDWWPWSAEALAEARRLDRPILLSVGYSACHWCHVMAAECFADPAIAARMNAGFVNLKVDREERPDLDRTYQLAHQLLTGRSGGWPLTVFLDPQDLVPYFAGTYFPPVPRQGMPAFPDLLTRAAEYFATQRPALRAQSGRLVQVLADLLPRAPAGEVTLTRAPLAAVRERLAQSFDGVNGGFGGAPKFPSPGAIGRLLRHWHDTAATPVPDLQALYMATLSLTRMAERGLNDQLGGGFCRYAVDAAWTIPHFEKMLSDNALLLRRYAEAAAATGDPLFRHVAEATVAFVQRELRAPEGLYCAALDADSDHEEGAYYVWDAAEIQRRLPADEWAVFAPRHGLDRAPNFEGRAWHLQACIGVTELAAQAGLPEPVVAARLESARLRLLAVRESRVRPGLDDKRLTAWNALWIGALATAARLLDRPDWADESRTALDALRERAWADGRLSACWGARGARFAGYLDDHAFLLEAVLAVMQAGFRPADLQFAEALAATLVQHFEDPAAGGFHFTADDAEQVVQRGKPLADDALPAGNGVAAQSLWRLGLLTGDARWLGAAERTLRLAWPALAEVPQAHLALLEALDDTCGEVETVIIRGPPAEVEAWSRALGRLYAPGRQVFAIPSDVAGLPDALAAKAAPGTATVAWLCRNSTCSAPVESLEQLARELRDRLRRD